MAEHRESAHEPFARSIDLSIRELSILPLKHSPEIPAHQFPFLLKRANQRHSLIGNDLTVRG
jgi:hypothetical protein